MHKSPSKIWLLCGIAVAAALSMAGTFQSDGDGYLKRVGPSPLRYQPARSSGPLNLPPLPKETNNTVDISIPPAPSPDFSLLRRPGYTEIPTELLAPFTEWLNRISGTVNPETGLPATNYPDTNAPPVYPPASEMLVPTPEMLADFFKPGPAPTNAANVMIHVPWGFMPAMPAMPAPQRDSTATYRTP